MDYDLILCEGTCEREFIGLLLERKLLIFSRERMLGGRIFHLRQLNPMIEEEIRSLNPGDTSAVSATNKTKHSGAPRTLCSTQRSRP